MLRIQESNNISLTIETISLEAGVLTNMVDTVKRLFPSLIDGVKLSFAKVGDLESPTMVFTKDQKNLIEKMKNVSFMDLNNFTVTVPEGFSATYIDALVSCDKALDYIESVKTVLLKEFRVYLSVFISNKDTKISSKDITFKFASYKANREAINGDFAKHYKDNSFEASVKLPVVIKRNADLAEMFNLANKVNARLKTIDLQGLKSEIQDIVELIETISSLAQRDKIETISPEAIKNISEGAYECATQVETVAACYFRVMTILKSVDDFTGKLMKQVAY